MAKEKVNKWISASLQDIRLFSNYVEGRISLYLV